MTARPSVLRVIDRLLWIDCIAAAVAGIGVLLLRDALAALYALPSALLSLIGVVNLCYATFSFSLAVRARRSSRLISSLAVANGGWAAICLLMALRYGNAATPFGLLQLVGEGIFVGSLGFLEWRWRGRLSRAA